MSPGTPGQLPQLGVGDFGPGMDHVVAVFQNDRILAIVHRSDPILGVLPQLVLDPTDPYTYVFIHGGQEFSRFENMQIGTHEIPEFVVVALLVAHFGSQLDGLNIRMATCYGNLLRPGDTKTAVQRLASLLLKTSFEGYHGLVHVDVTVSPPHLQLGNALAWDPVTGPYYLDPPIPGAWESIQP
jgi:hypothetical protein